MKRSIVGTICIILNSKMIFLLVDGAREIIGMGLNKLGYSLNDKNPTHIHQAEKICII